MGTHSPSSNLLQRGHPGILSAWKYREETAWAASVKRSVLLALLVASSLRLLSQAFSPTKNFPLISVAAVTLCYSLFICMTSPASPAYKWKMFVLLQLAQAYFVTIAMCLYPNCKELWALASTVVFCIYELASFHSRWLIAVLISRQFVMWHIPCACERHAEANTGLSLVAAGAAGSTVLWFTNEIRRRASEHYRFCESIEQQETKMTAILQAIPQGLAVITRQMQLTACNSLMELLLKSTSDDREMGGKLSMLFCLEHVETDSTMKDSLALQIEAFLSDSKQTDSTFGVTKIAGSFYEWKGTKCQWEDSTACILIAANISSWVSAQIRLTAESDSKTALLRFVSHELRTPANAILNLASSVKDAGNVNAQQSHELAVIVTSTYFLLSVVNDLLDFTRIVANKFALVKQRFEVRKEIKEIVSLVELQCAQRELFLKVKIDELIPETIYSDPNRLKQVLLNLLGNAVKFTFKGGIRVICMLTDRNMLRIAVKDTGIGIPEEKIAGLCQTFGTVEGTQRINPQGCGLGLYISNLLALSLGSKPIDIQSTVGIGSEFSFEVCFNPQDSAFLPGITDFTTSDISNERECESAVFLRITSGGLNEMTLELPKILIVDDSDFNRLVLIKMLQSFNLKAEEAISGLQALTRIKKNISRGHFYRLILMDIEMAEMDGITATQEIRTMELTGELAKRPMIIACSAHKGREEVEKSLLAGMDDYMEKPISKRRLEEVLSIYYTEG